MTRIWMCETCHKQFPYLLDKEEEIAKTNALACEASHRPIPILYRMAQEILELGQVEKTCSACQGYGSPCGQCVNGVRVEWHRAQERIIDLARQIALKVCVG